MWHIRIDIVWERARKRDKEVFNKSSSLKSAENKKELNERVAAAAEKDTEKEKKTARTYIAMQRKILLMESRWISLSIFFYCFRFSLLLLFAVFSPGVFMVFRLHGLNVEI